MARRDVLASMALIAAMLPGGLARGEAVTAPRRLTDQSQLSDSVRWALRGAQQRLARARCQQVLTDFRDTSGRSLRENLDAVGEPPDAFLGMLLFYDGSDSSPCSNRKVLAFTSPGNRAVFICRSQFLKKRGSDRGFLELTLIHEALHSLGLPENPPSPSEITRQVRSRCGY